MTPSLLKWRCAPDPLHPDVRNQPSFYYLSLDSLSNPNVAGHAGIVEPIDPFGHPCKYCFNNHEAFVNSDFNELLVDENMNGKIWVYNAKVDGKKYFVGFRAED